MMYTITCACSWRNLVGLSARSNAFWPSTKTVYDKQRNCMITALDHVQAVQMNEAKNLETVNQVAVRVSF